MFALLPLAGTAAAQEKAQPKGWVAAQIQFEKNCSKCHGNANSQAKTPYSRSADEVVAGSDLRVHDERLHERSGQGFDR